MSSIVVDLEQLYQRTFGSKPYKIGKQSPDTTIPEPYKITENKSELVQADDGSTLLTKFAGVEIWLPTWFRGLPSGIGENGKLFIPYSVVRITGKKTIIKTALAERKGTVKELYSIDDYQISIKGFLIDRARQWPLAEIEDLKKLFELNQAVQLDNALTNIFLATDDRVVIESIDFPEVEGGRKHVRPFSMQLESDSVFTLEAEA